MTHTDEGVDARPLVALYRQYLLPPSETFVKRQAESLERYRAHYVGVERLDGLPLDASRISLVKQARGPRHLLKAAVFERTGRSLHLERRLAQLGPSLVHAHFGHDGLQSLPLARRLGVPLVTTFQGYEATVDDELLVKMGPTQRRYVRNRARLIAGGDAFLAVSDFLRRRLLAQGFPEARLRVQYTGVDLEATGPPGSASREPIILFVGRLVEKKGLDHLLRAFAGGTFSEAARVVVIGDGPLRAGSERMAAELRVPTEFLGWCEPGEVSQWMRRARLLCAPSVTAANGDSEGLPNTVGEAAAAGTPTVGFHHAGIPEMVVDGETGLLAREGDTETLSRLLVTAMRDDELSARLGLRALERIRTEFDMRLQTARLERLYDELTGRS